MIKDIILGSSETLTSTGSGSGDSNWDKVSLLLTGNSLLDSSLSNNTVSIVGNTTTSSTQKKYNNTSIYFDGSGDELYVSKTTSQLIGLSNDFTVELWYYADGNQSAWTGIINNYQSGGWGSNSSWWLGYDGSGSNVQIGVKTDSSQTSTTPVNVSVNTWHHIAFVRYGNNYTMYLDGVGVGTVTNSGTIVDTSTKLEIGAWGNNVYNVKAYMSDIRITKGVARYTTTFTPPISSLPTAAFVATLATPASDPNTSKYVTLLLNGEGTNGSQNNTFIDSSSNNATVTKYGDVTQGSFGPFGNSWSVYLDGAGDDLYIPTSYGIGVGDFTVEAWGYLNVLSSWSDIICFIGSTSWGLTTNNGDIGAYNIGINTSGTIIPTNSWNHLSITRQSGTVRLFLNGSLIGSSTNNTSLDNTSVRIGAWVSSGTENWNGYISNLRVVKGTALYTSNFTPPTSPLTAVLGTVLLTCQSNWIKDNSVNNVTITVNGDTKVVKDSPFPEVYDKTVHGASVYIPSTSYLSIPTLANYGLDGDFTVEAWIYPNSYSTYAYIFSVTNNPNGFVFYINGGYLKVRAYYNTDLLSVTAPPLNVWSHVAATRSGSTLKIFINGVQMGSVSNSTIFPANAIRVGVDGTGGDWNGYISNLRVVKGSALYTNNFTPPSSPLNIVTNTSVLLKFDNAGIIDSSGKTDLTTYGNAQISTTSKKFGTGAIYFDGSGDYLITPPISSSYLIDTTVNYTIECWVNITANPNTGYGPVFVLNGGSSGTNGISVWIYNSTINFWNNGYSAPFGTSGSISFNTWYHIAYVKNGTTLTGYVNGISVGTATTVTANGATNQIYIGGTSAGKSWDGNYSYLGYIDDFRITKGKALYTSNFTPPTTSLTL
jgi:hypothetical protein